MLAEIRLVGFNPFAPAVARGVCQCKLGISFFGHVPMLKVMPLLILMYGTGSGSKLNNVQLCIYCIYVTEL